MEGTGAAAACTSPLDVGRGGDRKDSEGNSDDKLGEHDVELSLRELAVHCCLIQERITLVLYSS